MDGTTLDKPYSQKMELAEHFWSGKHHRTVKGLSLVMLYYADVQGRSLPVNYRVYDKADDKTKNGYFQDMLAEVLAWGLQPAFATGDSWYSCAKNLKTVKDHRMGVIFAVEANRTVSVEKGAWVQVQRLDVPEEGLMVWLRNVGLVKRVSHATERPVAPLRGLPARCPGLQHLRAPGLSKATRPALGS